MKIKIYCNETQHYLRHPEKAYIQIKSGYIWEHNGIQINDILKANRNEDNKTNCFLYEYTRLEFDFLKLKKTEIKRLKFKANCFISGKAKHKDVPRVYVNLNWFQRNKIYWQLNRTFIQKNKILLLIITILLGGFKDTLLIFIKSLIS